MFKFSSFITLPDQCVFALKNSISKKVYVGFTSTLKTHLGTLCKELNGDMKLEQDMLELSILETYTDIETLKLHTSYWIDRFIKDGYTLYKQPKAALKYRVSVRVSNNLRHYLVLLTNTRNDHKIVGVFPNKEAALTFVKYAYNESNPYNLPVYALNLLTKQIIQQDTEAVLMVG